MRRAPALRPGLLLLWDSIGIKSQFQNGCDERLFFFTPTSLPSKGGHDQVLRGGHQVIESPDALGEEPSNVPCHKEVNCPYYTEFSPCVKHKKRLRRRMPAESRCMQQGVRPPSHSADGKWQKSKGQEKRQVSRTAYGKLSKRAERHRPGPGLRRGFWSDPGLIKLGLSLYDHFCRFLRNVKAST